MRWSVRWRRTPRVVYVDNDPMVRAYAGQLLTNRFAAFVFGDLRDPDQVLGDRMLRSVIDFAGPVGLLMTAVMHFVADGADPWGLVSRYVAALPPGSYLALSHVTADNVPPQAVQTGLAEYAKATENIHPRSRAEVARFFAGLDLVPPWPGCPDDRLSQTRTGRGDRNDRCSSRSWWGGQQCPGSGPDL
jgi:hypothetical protein